MALNLFICSCFILTKWYVNPIKLLDKKIEQISFILTKWYVNTKKRIIKIISISGFILTKWYVNHILHLSLFYLIFV
ncbi:hypothetical protein BM530_21700, partial [Clostridioides difficile]